MTSVQELLTAFLQRPESAKLSPLDFGRFASGRSLKRPKHLQYINAKLLEAAHTPGKRLIILAPPRHGKSWLTSKFFPAWYLGCNPDRRVVLATYAADFSEGWGRATRDLLVEHGPAIFGISLNPDVQAAGRWDVKDRQGGMVALGVSGPLTGRGADLLICDDVVKTAAEAGSELQRENLWSWFRSVAYTRLEPGASIVITMTRWNEDDLCGRLLAAEGNQWDVCSLPALAEDDDPLGRKPGEALWPERFSAAELEATREQVGSYVWSALYQQSPVPAGGNIIQRSWFRYWQPRDKILPVSVMTAAGERISHTPVTLPEQFDETIQSWDLAFKESASSDFVVGQVWGIIGADRYLLDQVRARMDFPRTILAVKAMTSKWPNVSRKYVEAKANGEALLSSLRHEISGFVAVNPTEDKVSRIHAVSATIESGNVFLPHPHHAPWVDSFINECVSFPSAKFDDQVDAMSQALSQTLTRRKILYAF
jgi:predicted phage terminase large subunit-like protein